ncbi:MAG TPA: glycoside hydrolase family 3 protein, partial [Spirochaetia bacterium]|nr:glycoside hydrolase family 3 protein [Spirochaetia bacterium]
KRIVPLLLLALGARGLPGLSFNDPGDPAVLAGQLADAMSADELLGQVFFLGYQGVGPSPEIQRWIKDHAIGGVKLFPRNVSNLDSLAQDVVLMQRLAALNRFHIPLFMATDQEGGWVRQIKDETSISPGNLALGAIGAPQDSYLTGYYLGRELAALGINMDFAPTADVYANPDASVIGPRSFGSDPAQTGLLSAAYARGMQNAGVITVAKHFPGHGSADKDSHGRLPRIDVSLSQLLDRDLVPYRILISEGIPAIMTGHLAFPQILGNLTPSSLSPFFLQSVLRDRLGFKGLIITDDMEMDGVLTGGLDTPMACRRALEAGNDMVLISHTPGTQAKTWDELIRVMRQDPAFKAAVQGSVRRILETKLRFFRDGKSPIFPDPQMVRSLVPAPGAKDFFTQTAARAVTVITPGVVPFRPDQGGRILLAGQFPDFLSEGLRRFPHAETFLFPFSPFYSARAEDKAAMRARAGAADTIIFCLANFNSLDVLKELAGTPKKVVVISALSPVYLAEVPWVATAIAVYGDGPDSFRAGLAALCGDYKTAGSLPVRFPGLREAPQ